MSIYHYTSLDAAVKILQKEHICFWGTRYDSMNDPTDSIYAKEVVIPVFKKVVEESNLDDYEKDDSEAFPYIVSFSSKGDDFYMWRTYKADVVEKPRAFDPRWRSCVDPRKRFYFAP